MFVIEANGICIDEPSPPLRRKHYEFPHIDFSPQQRCIRNQMFTGNNVTPKEKSDRTRSPLENLDMRFPCQRNTLRCQKSREATKHLLILIDSGIMNFCISFLSAKFGRRNPDFAFFFHWDRTRSEIYVDKIAVLVL